MVGKVSNELVEEMNAVAATRIEIGRFIGSRSSNLPLDSQVRIQSPQPFVEE